MRTVPPTTTTVPKGGQEVERGKPRAVSTHTIQHAFMSNAGGATGERIQTGCGSMLELRGPIEANRCAAAVEGRGSGVEGL